VIPVYQHMTVGNDGRGNCFNACVASILERPLRDVCEVLPDFDGDYWGEWRKWLAAIGMEINWHPLNQPIPKGYAIATGYGGRFYPDGHKNAGKPIAHAAVVFNGEPVHDPFPGAKQFGEIKHYWPIDPISEDEEMAA
jgi:hypothetical protein